MLASSSARQMANCQALVVILLSGERQCFCASPDQCSSETHAMFRSYLASPAQAWALCMAAGRWRSVSARSSLLGRVLDASNIMQCFAEAEASIRRLQSETPPRHRQACSGLQVGDHPLGAAKQSMPIIEATGEMCDNIVDVIFPEVCLTIATVWCQDRMVSHTASWCTPRHRQQRRQQSAAPVWLTAQRGQTLSAATTCSPLRPSWTASALRRSRQRRHLRDRTSPG